MRKLRRGGSARCIGDLHHLRQRPVEIAAGYRKPIVGVLGDTGDPRAGVAVGLVLEGDVSSGVSRGGDDGSSPALADDTGREGSW